MSFWSGRIHAILYRNKVYHKPVFQYPNSHFIRVIGDNIKYFIYVNRNSEDERRLELKMICNIEKKEN